jgi:hypothetical protein
MSSTWSSGDDQAWPEEAPGPTDVPTDDDEEAEGKTAREQAAERQPETGS